jgi:hypothetical protein
MPNFTNFFARFWKKIDESWRVAIVVFIAARLFYTAWSWVVFTVMPVAVQNLDLAGQPILTVFSLEDNRGFTYLREVYEDILTFQSAGNDHVIDEQTGSLWIISNGTAIQGSLEGYTLFPAQTTAQDIFAYYDAAPYSGLWLSMWQRFDANWYVSLAENGYGNIAGDDHFPPLYPLLIRILKPVFGDAFLAGLFISHVATLIALKLLYEMFSEWGEITVGKRALLLFVIFPTFFFFFSAYSEPVFLITVLLSIKSMQSRSWAWAGFWIFCAILTRLQGAALLAPMLYLMMKDRPFLHKFTQLAALMLAGIGGLFYLYLRSMLVTSGAVPFIESAWHARLVAPWQTYGYALQTILSGNFTFIDFLNWSVATLFMAFLAWGWRRIPIEYNLYTAISLLIMLIRIVDTQPLISFSRYSLTLFPVFYSLGLAAENPIARRLLVYTFIPLNLYLSGQFFLWGWVA